MASYYGINVQLDEGKSWPEQVPRVCTDIKQVQLALKLNKTARFKQFDCAEAAESFSYRQLERRVQSVSGSPSLPGATVLSNSSNVSGEKPSPFRAPSRPECQELRTHIESGDLAAVQVLANTNPRLLINSGDTPTLLREGPRQNALHLAALSGRWKVCRWLLELVGDASTFQRLYPDDSPSVASTRASRAVDLYLNMPTRGSYETPLHLAAKFGYIDVVAVLVTYPACRRDVVNRHGQTPAELCCLQYRGVAGDCDNSRLRILDLLQEQYYVPVLADSDGTMSPIVASPCVGLPSSPLSSPYSSPASGSSVNNSSHGMSPASDGRFSSPSLSRGLDATPLYSPGDSHFSNIQQQQHSPLLSPLRVRAWAGPMSRSIAEEFFQRWRHPSSSSAGSGSASGGNCSLDTVDSPRISARQVRHVRATDPEKGLERIGRALASQMNVQWQEYWSFLGCNVDIASTDGLTALEAYLSRQSTSLLRSGTDLTAVSDCILLSPPLRPSPAVNGGVCDTALCSDNVDSESPELVVSPVTSLCGKMQKLSLSSPAQTKVLDPRENSDNGRAQGTHSSDSIPPSSSKGPGENGAIDEHMKDRRNCGEMVRDSTGCSNRPEGKISVSSSEADNEVDEDDDADVFYFTPPGSPVACKKVDPSDSDSDSADADSVSTPPLAPQAFIGGSKPSIADVHVFRALVSRTLEDSTNESARTERGDQGIPSSLLADYKQYPCVLAWLLALRSLTNEHDEKHRGTLPTCSGRLFSSCPLLRSECVSITSQRSSQRGSDASPQLSHSVRKDHNAAVEESDCWLTSDVIRTLKL